MRVELLYDVDCPNVEEARSVIRAALSDAGIPVAWTEWDCGDAATPEELRMYGSPTVLVNRQDVACEEKGGAQSSALTAQSAAPDAPGARCCRVYVDDCGCLCGVPTKLSIMTAILAALE